MRLVNLYELFFEDFYQMAFILRKSKPTFFILLVFFLPVTNFGQAAHQSRIVGVSGADTSLFKIKLSGALYDLSRNALPYFQNVEITENGISTAPTLVTKEFVPVSEPSASIIKKNYGNYLGADFKISFSTSKSVNQLYHTVNIIPFRINLSGTVEELTAYSINWRAIQTPSQGQNAKGASSFTNSSVLASGNWYKIGVTQTGLYKITRSFLSDVGINVGALDPRKIRVFGNGGKMVPERNADYRIDDLKENAITVVGESDGVFDNGDYVLFYATGTTAWKSNGQTNGLKFSATTSLYSDTSFYFINVDGGNGLRMDSVSAQGIQSNIGTSTYDYYNYHETNITNFERSGREFFGEYFDVTVSYPFSWSDGDFVPGDTLLSEVSAVGRNSEITTYQVNCSNAVYTFTTPGLNLNDMYEDYAAYGQGSYKGLCTDAQKISISVTKITPKSIGWLNKVTINCRRQLILHGKQFCFRDTRITGTGKKCDFTIANPALFNPVILNVTDPLSPSVQKYVQNGSNINFTANADSLNEYCIATANDFYTPAFVGKVVNQNLHAKTQADFVIVTHPLFLKEAEELGSFHRQKDGLSYVVAPIDQIYNEFGGGKQDPSAIRDFIRMLYSRNLAEGKQVKYVQLLGDGSYINKDRSLPNNSNLIPTYQSVESLSELESVATDDFYGMMDDSEGSLVEVTGKIDIGVGRMTCRTNEEVRAVLNKIYNYYKKDASLQINDNTTCSATESVMGDWRNWMVFLADDEDGALHMSESNGLTGIIKNVAPYMNTDKIYIDAYKRYSTPGGLRYPDATTDLEKRLKKGAFAFNYTGHGGEVGLTAERMVDLDLITRLDNFNQLALFITATCEFSRYDDPNRTSAGELCLLNSKGAAIALYTTCRIAFSTTNESLNIALLKYMFARLPNGKRPALGDIIRLTKAWTGQSQLANFHLLGDPALTLAYPQQRVVTTSINNKTVSISSSDTLSSLSKITISGYVSDTLGNKLTDFNGLLYPTVFDKEQDITCLLNSNASATNYYTLCSTCNYEPFSFKLQKNILYRGKIQVTKGDFSFSFLVPKDISFSPGPGKISYYATNGTMDANGTYTNLIVGGVSNNSLSDNEGPHVKLYMDDRSFVSGGITGENPVLFAELTDSSGINTSGTGIGHDISAILDQNTSNPVVLNDYYEAGLNSYQKGRVRYPYSDLAEGEHHVSFKVWDIQNNSSTVNSDFIVAKSAELALNHVLNYPNPFTSKTTFLFQHNQGCNPLHITVQIYTVSGKLVKTIEKQVPCDGNGPQGVDWDGRDDYGGKLGRGVYIYRLTVQNSENKKAEKIEKLVILN